MQVIDTPHPEASIFKPAKGVLPMMRGDGDMNLAVSEQIGDNVSLVRIIQEGGAAIIVSVQAGG